MPKKEDLKGLKFNMLTAIREVGKEKNGNIKWECVCDCGNFVNVRANNLKNNHTKSCGCAGKRIRSNSTQNNIGGTKLYLAWYHMIDRCINVGNKRYKKYGGRGITVCENWLNSFDEFCQDMQETHFDNAYLDRIDNNGNYCKENCRWVNLSNSNKNRGKHNGKMKYKGVQKTKYGKFRAYVHSDNKKYYCGVYNTIEEAASAYNNMAIKLHGEFACLNITE